MTNRTDGYVVSKGVQQLEEIDAKVAAMNPEDWDKVASSLKKVTSSEEAKHKFLVYMRKMQKNSEITEADIEEAAMRKLMPELFEDLA